MREQANSGKAPTTLRETQEWLDQWWPGVEPSGNELREWHEVRTKVFAQVAITDTDHRNEALALAGNEKELAKIYSSPNIRLPALIQLLRNQASRTRCNPRIAVSLRDRVYEIETVRLNGTDIVIYVSDR